MCGAQTDTRGGKNPRRGVVLGSKTRERSGREKTIVVRVNLCGWRVGGGKGSPTTGYNQPCGEPREAKRAGKALNRAMTSNLGF